MGDDKAKMLVIGEALVDLEHVDTEIRNHMTKKPDKTSLDSEEVGFCETRRAVSDRASGAENVKEVVKTMGGNISKEVKYAVDMTTGSEEYKESARIEEILRRMSCDKGWVAKEKCKIKEKLGNVRDYYLRVI